MIGTEAANIPFLAFPVQCWDDLTCQTGREFWCYCAKRWDFFICPIHPTHTHSHTQASRHNYHHKNISKKLHIWSPSSHLPISPISSPTRLDRSPRCRPAPAPPTRRRWRRRTSDENDGGLPLWLVGNLHIINHGLLIRWGTPPMVNYGWVNHL
mgnify:CR=1 FL=1